MRESLRCHAYLLLQRHGAFDLGETPSRPARRNSFGRMLSHGLGRHVVVHPHLQEDALDDGGAGWVCRGDKGGTSG